jgi:sugar phosphate isomerase/epimerase
VEETEKPAVPNLVASPCSNPEMGLDEVLAAYSEIGFRKFEVFTHWVKSAFDVDGDPAGYLDKGAQYRMRFASLHLPPVADDRPDSLERAIEAARFADAIGAGIVLFKAVSRSGYVKAARPFLDAIQGLNVTPVLQNHSGSAISTLDDFREVIEGIADPRMRTLLEVGHFHSVGVSWKEGLELLGDSVALVHIKDQIGAQSVPFGTGEIDIVGLFGHMRSVGYDGDYVVEMEVADKENMLSYLAGAVEYLRKHCVKEEC